MVQLVTAWKEHRSRPGASRRVAMSDLIARIARDRSDAAFRSLFETYGPRIRGYMVRQGADLATAEELAQETMLAVWSKAALYAPSRGSAATWIFSIARNLRIDRLRREVVWQELTDEDADTIPSDEKAPDEALAASQRQARVEAALAELPTDQREALSLAFVEGLSHSAIAERLALPVGTVKSRLRLGYQKVRVALEDLR